MHYPLDDCAALLGKDAVEFNLARPSMVRYRHDWLRCSALFFAEWLFDRAITLPMRDSVWAVLRQRHRPIAIIVYPNS